ncbi:hypothetical protein BEN78_09700 [Xanthomonas citri pv. mangiferaeindicae]|nr:hypothetical protein BEN78_09700 [Xanthomonas citri pv. mangiferaeindicae]
MDTVEDQMIVPPTTRIRVREPRAAYGVNAMHDDNSAIPGWPLSAHPPLGTHASARPRPH